jgi:hypothetical protein
MNDKPDGEDHFSMNAYQEAATLVLRLVGSALAAIGVIGPLSIAATKAIGQAVPDYPGSRWGRQRYVVHWWQPLNSFIKTTRPDARQWTGLKEPRPSQQHNSPPLAGASRAQQHKLA